MKNTTEEEFKNYISTVLKTARKESNVSQKEMAQKIESTQANVSQIENGKHFASTLKLYEYAKALNCDVEITFTKKE